MLLKLRLNKQLLLMDLSLLPLKIVFCCIHSSILPGSSGDLLKGCVDLFDEPKIFYKIGRTLTGGPLVLLPYS